LIWWRLQSQSKHEQSPPTPAATAAAIESALVLLQRNSWFVRKTQSSAHPYHSIKSHAVNLLVVGQCLTTALYNSGNASFGRREEIMARFKNYWKSIFRTDGPPVECPEGYNGCMFDGMSCMNCGMPYNYCPSLFRLSVELREYIASHRNDGGAADVSLIDAGAVVSTFQGAHQYPGAPQEVQEAAAAMVAEGLVRIDGQNWSFTTPMRPVQFVSSRDYRFSKLVMKPIT
jgi:hypothetical protein